MFHPIPWFQLWFRRRAVETSLLPQAHFDRGLTLDDPLPTVCCTAHSLVSCHTFKCVESEVPLVIRKAKIHWVESSRKPTTTQMVN